MVEPSISDFIIYVEIVFADKFVLKMYNYDRLGNLYTVNIPSFLTFRVFFRIEVLFWGLREMKRVQWMPVKNPRVDIECAGHMLQSNIIQSMKSRPNFNTAVKMIDVVSSTLKNKGTIPSFVFSAPFLR